MPHSLVSAPPNSEFQTPNPILHLRAGVADQGWDGAAWRDANRRQYRPGAVLSPSRFKPQPSNLDQTSDLDYNNIGVAGIRPCFFGLKMGLKHHLWCSLLARQRPLPSAHACIRSRDGHSVTSGVGPRFGPYRGTSPIRNNHPLGPYGRTMPRALRCF